MLTPEDVERIADAVVRKLNEPFISYNEACSRYKRTNVDNWIKAGSIHPASDKKKMRISTSELEIASKQNNSLNKYHKRGTHTRTNRKNVSNRADRVDSSIP